MAEERGSKQASQEESGEERQQRSPGTRKKSSGTRSRQRSSGRTTSKKPSSGRRQSGSGDGRDQEEQESTQEREQSSADQGGQEPADQEDQEPADQRNQERAPSGDGEGTAEPPREPSGVQLVKRGKELLAELTGHRPESVSGLDRHDGGWRLTVEVLELSRIPPSTDVLGTYQLDMTESGELTGYRRTDRYYRNQAQQRSE